MSLRLYQELLEDDEMWRPREGNMVVEVISDKVWPLIDLEFQLTAHRERHLVDIKLSRGAYWRKTLTIGS